MRPAFLSERNVEHRATAVLSSFERQTGTTVQIPVPIEEIVDLTLDIPVLWQSLAPVRGAPVAGKFVQPTLTTPARIILNEDLLDTVFGTTPGFERTTLAHEAGHAVLHQEAHRSQQLGLDLDLEPPARELVTSVDFLHQAILMRGPDGDEAWREWQAHTFMRFILMPRRLLLPLLSGGRYLSWSGPGGLYDLRDRLGVTVSALVVHLSKLGFIHVDENRVIHDRRAPAIGQRFLRP